MHRPTKFATRQTALKLTFQLYSTLFFERFVFLKVAQNKGLCR